jgi:predicted AAA+ superfamily ATPase
MLNRELLIDYLKKDKKFRGIERELQVETISGKITTIIGPRRSGKTCYLLHLLNNEYPNALYLNFEMFFLRNIQPEDFFEILKIFNEIYGYNPKGLLLDEIQEVKDWQSLLRSLLDYGFTIFVTGSSSKLLSKEIATSLRGRSISYLLLTFSFRKFLKSKNLNVDLKYPTIEEKGKILNLLNEYLEYGGYPEVVLADNKYIKEKILKTYFDEIFLKDFVERHQIRSIEMGRFLFEFFFQNYSNEISIKNILNYLQERVNLSKKTLYSYLDKVQDTLSVFFLDKYSKSVYLRKEFPKKIYIVDTGLSLSYSENIGRKMENVVFIDLLRKTNYKPFMEFFYLKTKENYEVDFVVKEGNRISKLIQVTYANSFDEISPREYRSLLHVNELFKSDKPELIMITWDYEDEKKLSWFGKEGTIKFVPLWRWLLEI